MNGSFLLKLLGVTVVSLFLIVAWQLSPLLPWLLVDRHAEPRLVTARGELAADEQATIALFENVRESVVFITTTERVVDYWTRDALNVPRGTGSGFVWDERGHVVTNAHVIAGSSNATVRLADGRAFPAALVGASPEHDLAVLRIGVGVGRPPPLPIGTSADLQVGQKVFAIGNPFGLDWTLTTGVISALDRALPQRNGSRLIGLIQTDAAINPGNSGGPLLDSAGRLIGVNTAIYSLSGASAGIGFAVPVDLVNRVVPQLIARGRYVPPTLGVEVDAQLNATVTRRLGVEGVLVLGVRPGSGADRAGVRAARLGRNQEFLPGDVIIAVDEEPVTSVPDLLNTLAGYEVGDVVTLRLLRDGEPVEAEVALQPAA